MSAPRPCRGCGMTIEQIVGPNGKPIPAQKVRTVYVARTDLVGERELEKLESVAGSEVYVSHFETCPNANDFSRRRRG